jgi:hypothetical protein
MYLRILAIILLSTLSAGNAFAGWNKWSSEVKVDPFTKGEKVFLDFSLSRNSSLNIKCDTSKSGIEILAIPGWRGDQSTTARTPQIQLAIDGDLLFAGETVNTSVGLYGGDYLVGISALLDPRQSVEFINRFARAKRQIAMNDGMSSGPMIATARGSTKSGKSLTKCLGKQVREAAPEPAKKKSPSLSPESNDEENLEAANNILIYHTIMIGTPYCGFRVSPKLKTYLGREYNIPVEVMDLHEQDNSGLQLIHTMFKSNEALKICKEISGAYLDARFAIK